LLQELPVFLLDAGKDVLPVTDEVHLVDDDRHLLHAQHGQEVAVPFGLFPDALQRVDQQ